MQTHRPHASRHGPRWSRCHREGSTRSDKRQFRNLGRQPSLGHMRNGWDQRNGRAHCSRSALPNCSLHEGGKQHPPIPSGRCIGHPPHTHRDHHTPNALHRWTLSLENHQGHQYQYQSCCHFDSNGVHLPTMRPCVCHLHLHPACVMMTSTTAMPGWRILERGSVAHPSPRRSGSAGAHTVHVQSKLQRHQEQKALRTQCCPSSLHQPIQMRMHKTEEGLRALTQPR